MGVRVVPKEGESIERILKRFRTLVHRRGNIRLGGLFRWHKKQVYFYQKPSVLRRRKRLLAKNETFRGECARRRIGAPKRMSKHARINFARFPIVTTYPQPPQPPPTTRDRWLRDAQRV